MTSTLEPAPTKPTLSPKQIRLIKVAATLHGLSDCLRLDVQAGESSDYAREHLIAELRRLSREVDKLSA